MKKISMAQLRKKPKREEQIGYSSTWIRRYRAMLEKWDLINSAPKISRDYKKGFKYCMETFISSEK